MKIIPLFVSLAATMILAWIAPGRSISKENVGDFCTNRPLTESEQQSIKGFADTCASPQCLSTPNPCIPVSTCAASGTWWIIKVTVGNHKKCKGNWAGIKDCEDSDDFVACLEVIYYGTKQDCIGGGEHTKVSYEDGGIMCAQTLCD